MDVRRIRAGEVLAALAGVALFVSLFLPWYSYRLERGGRTDPASRLLDGELTAWESFALTDLLLALLALAALALIVVTAAQHVPAVPLALSSLLVLASVLGLLLVLARLIWEPSAPDVTDAGAPFVDWTREPGVFVALASVLLIGAGCLIAMRDERRSPEGGHTDLSGRPVPPPPAIEVVPAPRTGKPAG
jgi:hypothetical protein